MDVSKDAPQNPFKRSRINQDPDYDEAAPPDEKRLKYLEDQARSELTEKVKRILNKQFEIEMNQQQSELEEIENNIVKVQENLLLLRSVATTSFYSKGVPNVGGSQQLVIHPEVKRLIGKRPKNIEETATPSPSSSRKDGCNLPTSEELGFLKTDQIEKLKVPRYIPPNIPVEVVQGPTRGERLCAKKKLVIGNVSRWIPSAEQESVDARKITHKWMVYVRGPKEEPNISSFVSQVTFYLDSSYAPHDVIEVRSHPFHLTRRGWGEFPVRVRVQFHNPLCKPVNIVHHLKLDQSLTGLQTLGAETIFDVMIHTEEFTVPKIDSILPVKAEPEEAETEMEDVEPEAQDVIGSLPHIKTEPEDVEPEPNHVDPLIDVSHIKSDPDAMDVDVQMKDPPVQIKLEAPQPPRSPSIRMAPLNAQSIKSLSNKIPGNTAILNRPNIITASNPRKMLSIIRELRKIKTVDLPTNAATNTTTRIVTTTTTAAAAAAAAAAGSSPSKMLTKIKLGDASTAPASGRPAVTMPTFITLRNPDGTLTSAKVISSPIYLKSYQQRQQVKPGESLLIPRMAMPIKSSVLSAAGLASGVLTADESVAGSGSLLKGMKAEVKKNTGQCRVADHLYAEEMRLSNQSAAPVKSIKWRCRKDCIRHLANVYKLVDLRAVDPAVRCCRPYTAPSLDVYRSWSVGKQRGAEWMRAKAVADVMSQCRFDDVDDDTVWSTKKIMAWYRRYGYSDFQSWIIKAPAEAPSVALTSTLTEARIDNPQEVVDDVVIDVESTDAAEAPRSTRNLSLSSMKKMVVALDDTDPQLTSHIVESMEQLGFKLGPDVLDADSVVPLARIIFSSLWKRMADDLIRLSLNESWLRAKGGKPEAISLADVHQAIHRRPEFDVLTNDGLGIEVEVEAE